MGDFLEDPSEKVQSIFPDTRWTLVRRAQAGSTAERFRAFSELCEIYRTPLLQLARVEFRLSEQDAEDRVQSYIQSFQEREWIDGLDPAKGKLRSFLQVSFKNFQAKERRAQQAQKRGGDQQLLSIQNPQVEAALESIPASTLSPEKSFDRLWAREIWTQAVGEARERFLVEGEEEEFEELLAKAVVDGTAPSKSYLEIEAKTGIRVGAAKMRVKRLRQVLGAALDRAIAETVSNPQEFKEERRYLMELLCVGEPFSDVDS
ncbi:MAG: hypothetical protein AAF585_01185 [Verrucomicrobiota bacterium]